MFKEGKKVVLQPYSRGLHTPFIYNWLHEERAKYYTTTCPVPMSLEDVDNLYGTFFKTLMIYKKDNFKIGPIGFIGYVNKNGVCESGGLIDKNFENGDYFLDACQIFTVFVFDTLNVHKIVHIPCKANIRMVELERVAGMVEEAEIPDEFFIDGKWHPKICFAMYREQYIKYWRE